MNVGLSSLGLITLINTQALVVANNVLPLPTDIDPHGIVAQCQVCIDDLDDAKDCLRLCNARPFDPNDGSVPSLKDNGSILNACLDPDGDSSIEDIDDLVACCGMTKSCERDLERSQECVKNCFHPCMKDTAVDYLDCIHDEDKGVGNEKCSRQECLDGFLDELPVDLEVSGSSDILDVRNIEKRIKKIETDDLEDCSLLEDFVDSVCDIGDDCCKRCNPELSDIVDCLVNDIVIPFVAIEMNYTIAECPIDECAVVGGRKLAVTKGDETLFTKALNLPRQSSAKKAALAAKIEASKEKRVLQVTTTSEEAVAVCQNKMNMDTVAHNITHAATKYMECVTAAAIDAFPEEDESGAAAALKLSAIAMTLALLVSSL